MSRNHLADSLVFLLCIALSPALAWGQDQVAAPADAQQLPSFLLPPPMELLREGLKPLASDLPDTGIREGLVPPDASQGLFSDMERRATTFRGGEWVRIEHHWLASELRHRPLYFEDAMLERHGQSRHPLAQPFVSGTRFFFTFPALPYAMTVDPPRPAQSTLGHFRAGSGAPYLLQRPPWQRDAALVEAGLIVGLVFLLP